MAENPKQSVRGKLLIELCRINTQYFSRDVKPLVAAKLDLQLNEVSAAAGQAHKGRMAGLL